MAATTLIRNYYYYGNMCYMLLLILLVILIPVLRHATSDLLLWIKCEVVMPGEGSTEIICGTVSCQCLMFTECGQASQPLKTLWPQS